MNEAQPLGFLLSGFVDGFQVGHFHEYGVERVVMCPVHFKEAADSCWESVS